MPKPLTIALDAMGGDAGPAVSVPAALAMLEQHPELNIVLVGQVETLQARLSKGHPRLRLVDAREVVAMDEKPSDALRKKKDSSLRVAINLVKEGAADACVSAGNTGALMATGKFVLKTLPGIDRPAIMAAIPTISGNTHMLDLGANTDCTADHLFQFAVMGSVVSAVIENIRDPRVALLNIGEEEIKGNDTIRQAHAMLSASSLNYVGFIEGDQVGKHRADVIVCDGFSGNVALKVMEGTASLVSHYIKQGFGSGIYGRFAGLVALPVLKNLRDALDPRRYNGASFLGLNGIVVKSHGGADTVAFQQAIQVAMLEVEKGVPDTINKMLSAQTS
ncbi:MAG: phosphate acyltransferase PlsX [Gammaproteobacteria bacterium]|jgi:glycerol-3-phosphate acyltransferase PlsX|nr:phosphate acyltransferase PlsX [Gammaproteobacteria bacterium]